MRRNAINLHPSGWPRGRPRESLDHRASLPGGPAWAPLRAGRSLPLPSSSTREPTIRVPSKPGRPIAQEIGEKDLRENPTRTGEGIRIFAGRPGPILFTVISTSLSSSPMTREDGSDRETERDREEGDPECCSSPSPKAGVNGLHGPKVGLYG